MALNCSAAFPQLLFNHSPNGFAADPWRAGPALPAPPDPLPPPVTRRAPSVPAMPSGFPAVATRGPPMPTLSLMLFP